jgi:protein TonB
MLAIEAPVFAPRPSRPRLSRKLVLAIAGSLLLHAVLLAWLPPLVPILREVGRALPTVLEVHIAREAPAPVVPAAPAPPSRVVQPAPAAVKSEAPVVSAPVAALIEATPVSQPAAAPMPEVSAAPRTAPVEPAPITPPDVRVAYLSNPRPAYPLTARRLGLEGRVTLRAEILENGSCGRIAVAQSSGHELLDSAALQAVKQWHFMPARRGGEAVAAWAEIPVSFRLREVTGS